MSRSVYRVPLSCGHVLLVAASGPDEATAVAMDFADGHGTGTPDDEPEPVSLLAAGVLAVERETSGMNETVGDYYR